MPPQNSSSSPDAAISDAEWIVMKPVWRAGSLTANQVVNALEGQTSWKPKTIHTLLSRLVKKGVLSTSRQGREYTFIPLLSEHECVHAESRSFLDRVFDGKIAPFLACFVDRGDLTPQEVRELKRILEKKTK